MGKLFKRKKSLCPACDSEIKVPGFGRFHCGQCTSTLIYDQNGLREIIAEKQVRDSAGTAIRTFRAFGPQDQRPVCVNCGERVNPGFCNTGSVLQGIAFLTRTKTVQAPIKGVIETWERVYILGGEVFQMPYKVPFWPRKRGYLCDQCCSDPGCVEKVHRDGSREKIRRVLVDARPGFLGSSTNPGYNKRESVRRDVR